MRLPILTAITLAALTAPAFADAYPVSGRWGQGTGSEKGPIDCTGKRVVGFNGDQRTDSKGGVPAYRNVTVTRSGQARWRIVDEFNTGQIRARATLTLHQIDADHIEMILQPGGTVKLQRCK